MARVVTRTTTLPLDGRSLRIDDVVGVARARTTCTLAREAVPRIEASRALKLELVEREVPIYGVTTGFGDSANRQIAPSKAARLQHNLLRDLGTGSGPIAAPDVTRATMLLRANCLARGNSGVRTSLIERLLLFLNADILPLVPERGSLGASGDLVPLSYIGSALVGEADVLRQGRVEHATDVLMELDLEPMQLEAKEGLALTNGTSFMTAFAALAVHDCEQLADVSDLCTAMASEVLLGNRGHFNAFIFEQKPHPGAVRSAAAIRGLLDGSRLSLDRGALAVGEGLHGHDFVQLDRQVQDRYSVRCAPHVTGALRDTLEWVRRWVEIEMNSSDDNPLFDVEGRRAQSGGNFYGGHMTQAMDALKIAVANSCDLLDRQLELVVDEKFNQGLTPNLIPPVDPDDAEAGVHHGFKGMQISCSALTAEALKLSNPASIHSRSTEAHNQDKVSMGAIAARDARTIVDLAMTIASIHLIALCQALDLRGLDGASPATRSAHARLRAMVPFRDDARRMDRAVERVADAIRSGVFRAA